MFVELKPASDVYELLGAALKTADVRPGLLRVEREYGTLEIHGFHQEGVKVARGRSPGPVQHDRSGPLEAGGRVGQDRHRRGSVEAQLVNQASRGGLLLKGRRSA